MKKLLLFFIFLSSVSVYSKLAMLEDESVRVCIVCKEPLSIAQIFIIEKSTSANKSLEYICEKCRKEEKGPLQLEDFNPFSYSPIIRVVPGSRDENAGESLEQQRILLKNYSQEQWIRAKLVNGYALKIKKGKNLGDLSLYKLPDTHPQQLHHSRDDISKMKKIKVADILPQGNHFLVIPQQDLASNASSTVYFYYPEQQELHRCKSGELLNSMSNFNTQASNDGIQK
jgi:hypothetical protein